MDSLIFSEIYSNFAVRIDLYLRSTPFLLTDSYKNDYISEIVLTLLDLNLRPVTYILFKRLNQFIKINIMNKNYLFLLFFAFSAMLFVGCNEDDEFVPPNYVTFERDKAVNVGVEIGGTATHDITVYTANITGNDRNFEILVNSNTNLDAAGYEVPATVTVPGGTNMGTFTVEVSDMDLGVAGKELVLDLAETKELSSGKSYVITVFRTCEGTDFVIDFEFDGYASETSWELADADGNVLVTGGDYEDGTATASRSLCLDSGTYTFTVTDSYGDGLTYPNTGSITLSYAGDELAVIDGDFGSETSVEVSF